MRTISSEEIAEWAAYYQLDPFGSWRGDMQAGIVASTMANIHAKKGHHFTATDFMPKFGEAEVKKTMTPQEIQERLRMMFGRNRG